MSTIAEEVAIEFEADPAEVDKFLFAEVQVGIEVEEFFQTTVGRYFKGRCEEAVRAFTAQALRATPDPATLEAARANAFGAQRAMTFLVEAIVNGRNAESSLKARDESDFPAH